VPVVNADTAWNVNAKAVTNVTILASVSAKMANAAIVDPFVASLNVAHLVDVISATTSTAAIFAALVLLPAVLSTQKSNQSN